MKAGKDLRYEFKFEIMKISEVVRNIKSLHSRGLISDEDNQIINEILGKYIDINKYTKIKNGLIESGKYTYEQIQEALNSMNDMKKYIKNSIGDRLDKCDIEKIQDILRKYLILRWNLLEAKTGIKTLPGNIKGSKITVSLADVIPNSGAINIEAIAVVNGDITDVSNYFVLTYYESNDPDYLYAINLPQKSITSFDDYFISNLMENIYNLSETCLNNKNDIFKASKRLWSLCRYVLLHMDNDNPFHSAYYNISNKLIPLMSGEISKLNKIKSELSTIKDLIKIKPINLPHGIIIKQLNNMLYDLNHITLLSNEDIEIFRETLENYLYIENYNIIINLLNEIIQSRTFTFLINNDLLSIDKNEVMHFDDLATAAVTNKTLYKTIFGFEEYGDI